MPRAFAKIAAMPSQVRLVRNYVAKLEEIISRVELFPRNANQVMFDSVALQSISKGFGLARAALLLIEKGYPDEAYGLSRSLVECAVGLRHITADPVEQEKRTKGFIHYDQTERNYWLHQARQYVSNPAMLQEIESSRIAKELDAKQLDPKDAFRHWSSHRSFIWEAMTTDHPLDATTNTVQHRKIAFAVDYHAPSQYVHCSQRGLDNYFHDPNWAYTVQNRRSSIVDHTAPKTLCILCHYLHQILCYAFFGLNLDRPREINKLFAKVIAKLEPNHRAS
jgi:Family of unknown function (DUF5677)